MSRTFALVVVGLVVLAAIAAAAQFAFNRIEQPRAPQVPGTDGGLNKGPSPVGRTVFLTFREPGSSAGESFPPQHLHRELARQAFLIAARDEIGLPTRDALLREDFPEKPDAESLPFEMFSAVGSGKSNPAMRYVLSRPGWDDTELWKWSMELDLDDPRALVTLVEQADAWSRGDLKDVLTNLGAKGTVPSRRAAGDVPKGTDELLWSWNEISVLGGLRGVHAEIHEHGESPELLAALAVGYANLASLTEYQYTAAYKAYYARALIYAQRLVRETDAAPWALWQRAYVRMQVGLHTFAADDIAAARKQQGAAGAARPVPFFADVLEAFGQGRLSQMSKMATTPKARQLAAYLALEAVAFSNADDLCVQAARELLENCPDCPRGYDAQSTSHTLGPAAEAAYGSWERTSQFLRKRLPDVPGIPKPAALHIAAAETSRDPAPEIAFRTKLIASLEQSGRPGLDAGEPSLSALGHLIEEINFAQALRRLELDAFNYGLPTDDLVAALTPLVAKHPYADYLARFRQGKNEKEAGAKALKAKIVATELSFKQRSMLTWLSSVLTLGDIGHWYGISRKQGDVIFSDLMRDFNTGVVGNDDDPQNVSYIAMMSKVSDKLPVVVALKIQRDWTHVEPDADRIEREYSGEPLVLTALSNRYYRLRRYQDAERCARRLVEVHRTFTSYHLLAFIYKALDDDVSWQKALEQSLALPSEGLEHATAQNEIAVYLLERHRAKEAVVYADQAAQSYSGWSILTAARCHESLGDWEQAEQLVRACSARYEGSVQDWMYWCHRTGHGHVQAADDFTRSKYEAFGKATYPNQERDFGHFFLLTNDPDQALVRYRRAYDIGHDTATGLYAALVADQLGKAADRDAILSQIANGPLGRQRKDREAPYRNLVAQLKATLPPKSAPRLNFVEVDKILATAPSVGIYAATLPGFVGIFLKNRGDLEGARKYLIRAAQTKDWQNINQVLAYQLLREMKVEVPPADDRPIEPPPPPMARHKAA
jgi:hypothetical protein